MNESQNILEKKIWESGIIAVLVIDRAEDAVPLAKALLEGGIDIIELTLRTPEALQAIRNICDQVPDMLVGAGTVITRKQVIEVRDAGARFAVAPGCNPEIIMAAQRSNLPFYPGVATPSDIEAAVALGCKILKFFPAKASGGLKYLKSMAGPYSYLELKFIPLGGLNQDNFSAYLQYDAVLAVGGSWIAKRETILAHDWSTITQNAKMATDTIRRSRGV